MSASLHNIDLFTKKVRVLMCGEPVGTLAQTPSGPLAFQYDATWLEHGYSISPLSLPLTSEVFVAKPDPLDGVFGVFDDSLPDGWGHLLVDRTLHAYGIDPATVSPLAHLAIVGTSGMGALEYEPEISLTPPAAQRSLDEIAAACADVLKTNHSNDLDTLFVLGGSSGGARPKIMTQNDGEEWIVKFPSSYDPKDIGVQEYAIAQAAVRCGIEMPPVRLLPSKRCRGFFAVKRFDRVPCHNNRPHKIHMASVGALLETSHRIPNLDYDLLMRLTLLLTDNIEELVRLYRLMTFNVLIGNRDDHAKNFTFMRNAAQEGWTLSPAYDLTRNSGVNGEHATTVNGKGKGITRDDVVAVGTRAGIPKAQATNIADDIEEIARELLTELDAGQ